MVVAAVGARKCWIIFRPSHLVICILQYINDRDVTPGAEWALTIPQSNLPGLCVSVDFFNNFPSKYHKRVLYAFWRNGVNL